MLTVLSCTVVHANEPAQKIDFTEIANDAIEIREAIKNSSLKKTNYTVIDKKAGVVLNQVEFTANNITYNIWDIDWYKNDDSVRVYFEGTLISGYFDLNLKDGEIIRLYQNFGGNYCQAIHNADDLTKAEAEKIVSELLGDIAEKLGMQ